MMNKYTKLTIFLCFIVLSIIFFIYKSYTFGYISIIISIIFGFLIFRNEFLILAFFRLYRQDINGVEECLKNINDPKLQLTKNQIADYYFLYGILYFEKNILKSEKYMKKALHHGLKIKQNIAIAKINLAIAAISKGDKHEASILLSEIKKMHVHKTLKHQIKIIQMKIKKMNVKKNMTNPIFRK